LLIGLSGKTPAGDFRRVIGILGFARFLNETKDVSYQLIGDDAPAAVQRNR
jgi:hypothetical protein